MNYAQLYQLVIVTMDDAYNVSNDMSKCETYLGLRKKFWKHFTTYDRFEDEVATFNAILTEEERQLFELLE